MSCNHRGQNSPKVRTRPTTRNQGPSNPILSNISGWLVCATTASARPLALGHHSFPAGTGRASKDMLRLLGGGGKNRCRCCAGALSCLSAQTSSLCRTLNLVYTTKIRENRSPSSTPDSLAPDQVSKVGSKTPTPLFPSSPHPLGAGPPPGLHRRKLPARGSDPPAVNPPTHK